MHHLLTKCFQNAGLDPSKISGAGAGAGASNTGSRGGPVRDDITGQTFFARVVSRSGLAQMRGEAESLRAMRQTAPEGLVPTLYALEVDEGKGGGGAMVTQYFQLGSGQGRGNEQRELGKMLAQMHNPPDESSGAAAGSKGGGGGGTVTTAEGYTGKYGFGVPTHCGATEQDNTWEESWEVFWRDRRLGDLVRRIGDNQLSKAWKEMQARAVPLLLQNITPAPKPVIIHGDLWSGNVGFDKVTSSPVIYDPSSYYGHNEAELGITRMFGGFSQEFYDAYHAVHIRSEPYYEQRQDLYELYHHLNHTLMFGGGYKSGALRIMQSLIAWAQDVGEK